MVIIIKIYNDSKATNTDASIIALKAFDQPVILLMGGFDKGLDLQEMATYKDKIKRLVTFGAAGKRFKEDMKVENSICVNNLKEATLEAIKNAQSGDIYISFNTSYVVIKHTTLSRGRRHFICFNTSYVVIKLCLKTILVCTSICFNTSYVVIKP